jgi:SlyX protein
MIDDQIVELQTRLSFQEDAIQALNLQVAKQDQELQITQRQILLLNQKINDLFFQLEKQQPNGGIERPPHY